MTVRRLDLHPRARLPVRETRAVAAARALAAVTAVALSGPVGLERQALAAQSLDDPTRLAGVEAVAVRASAEWDELITTSAGGATSAQFVEALQLGLEAALGGVATDAAAPGPALVADAPGTLACHVDTFYETGLIVYSVHAALEEPDATGRPVVTWLESSVGSYTVQQLHLVWTLADQCVATFLDAWREGNPG